MVWTPFGLAERLRHLRLLPIAVGAGSAAGLLHLLSKPGDDWTRTGAIVILGGLTLLFGGLGLLDLVLELRRRRWRGASVDGRDRALVVMVGSRVSYGFGETLRYEPIEQPSWAAALDSAKAAAALPTLRAALPKAWAAYVRQDLGDPTLFEGNDSPDEDWALLLAATLIGLAGRGQILLLRGHYVGWGRGRARMKNVTKGLELGLVARRNVQRSTAHAGDAQRSADHKDRSVAPDQEQPANASRPADERPGPERAIERGPRPSLPQAAGAPLERALVELADGNEHTPARLEDVALQLVERGLGPMAPGASTDGPTPTTEARVAEAWRTLLDQEPELLTLTVEHALSALRRVRADRR